MEVAAAAGAGHRATEAFPRLGVGLSYRRELRRHLDALTRRIDFLEVIADQYLDRLPETIAELKRLRALLPIVPHGLALSLGSAEGLDEGYLDRLARLVEHLGPPWLSEHLGFTRAAGLDLDHFAPLPHTWEAVEVVRRNVARARSRLGVPLLLENITAPFLLPGAEMSEAAFLAAILDGTDTGLLLDLTNLHVNRLEFGTDVDAFLAEAPLQRVVEIHVAGARCTRYGWIDSHDAPVPEAVWDLVARVLAVTPACALVLERDERLDAFSEIDADLARANEIWERIDGSTRTPGRPRPEPPRPR